MNGRPHGVAWRPMTGKAPNVFDVEAWAAAHPGGPLNVPPNPKHKPPKVWPAEAKVADPLFPQYGERLPDSMANAVRTYTAPGLWQYVSFGAPIGSAGPRPAYDPPPGSEWVEASGWTWTDDAPGYWTPWRVWKARAVSVEQAPPTVTIGPTVVTSLVTDPTTGQTEVKVTDGKGGSYTAILPSKAEAKAYAERAKKGQEKSDQQKAAEEAAKLAGAGGAGGGGGAALPPWVWAAGLGVLGWLLWKRKR